MAKSVEHNAWRSIQRGVSETLSSATAGINRASGITQAQYAQQRLTESSLGLSNPPFLLTRDRNPLIDSATRIKRGYIRRADIDPADPTSQYRLYFMFNPATIKRDYIAYLDQAALDPGNALFGSNNMSAAPGIIDFSFELLFDRHIETAQDPSHPGTKVDYDYFDLVVRGVVPNSGDSGNAIPDNGIMMVNPNNVTVVFGEDLTVTGRPYNAAISFDKFNHLMIPTRMTIGIVMKAFYIGPIRTNSNFSTTKNEEIIKATIPYTKSAPIVKFVVGSEFDSLVLADSAFSAFKSVAKTATGGTAPSSGDPSGRVLTIPQAGEYAKAAGFTGEDLVTVVAIAVRESSLRTDARGDTTITTDTWGPSIGLMQIRSLNDQKGTGGPRDEEANLDPAHNMWAAWIISGQATNFGPWSVFSSGSYLQARDQVRQELTAARLL